MCRADVRNSEKYLEWLDEECNLLVDSKEEISKKIQAEKKGAQALEPCILGFLGSEFLKNVINVLTNGGTEGYTQMEEWSTYFV